MATAARCRWIGFLCCCTAELLLCCFLSAGCGGSGEVPDPDVKQNLRSLFEVYQMYTNDKRLPPPDEAALRSYVETLPADRKASMFLPPNLDHLFVSVRDGQKFAIKYGVVPDPTVAAGLAWEQNGKDGKRFVALSMGYVEEYDEASFQALQK
ncbi:MAG TPA: hypothetical protein VFB96_14570 [Pirellulaceae bacterium]|nr:hypothetical protein [Pirellulaceae bacterium]